MKNGIAASPQDRSSASVRCCQRRTASDWAGEPERIRVTASPGRRIRSKGPLKTAVHKVGVALALAIPLISVFSGGAAAHIIEGTASGFGQGFEHPLTGPDHFLAMFAVGIWGAQMGGRAVWALPVTFPLIMAAGGLGGMLGLPLPHVELGIALSILALGSAIAFAWRPVEVIALMLIGVFAICHGYAHGVELPIAADPADYAAGFVIATGLIHLLGVGVGLGLGRPFDGRLARTLGVVIAVGGIYFLVA